MTHEEIKSALKEYLTEELYFDFAETSDDASLFETGNIDSLGFVNLVIFLQSTYGVTFASSDLRPETFCTVNVIAGIIASRTSAAVK